jgi:mono/diheme cytochrome c family protein
MKNRFLFPSLLLASVVLFSNCKKTDDKTDDPVVDPNEVAYSNANKSNGGIMYDKFWAEESTFDQANTNIPKFSAASDFFRCKQCHGWDGLGSKGSYINRAPSKTRPNISDINIFELAKTKTAKELYDLMKKSEGRRDISFDLTTYDPATNKVEGDKMPNYSQYMTDAQIWDMVKFMKEGMLDVSTLYDATYTGTYPIGKASFKNIGRDGNAESGNAFYTVNCKACHGVDGKKILMESMTAGKFTRSKPNEVQHKVQNGQLGSTMVGEFNMSPTSMKDLYKALSDTLAYPN